MEASKLHLLGEAILELNDPTLPAEGLFDRVAAQCESLIPNSSLWVACSDTRQRAITCYFGPCRQQAIDLAPEDLHAVDFHQPAGQSPFRDAATYGTRNEFQAGRNFALGCIWEDGKTNEEIAGVLGISLFTVKAHLRGIFPILMVENRNAAAAVAWQAWQKATVVRREGVEEGT